MTTAPLLSVRGLAKHYQTRSATLKILDARTYPPVRSAA